MEEIWVDRERELTRLIAVVQRRPTRIINIIGPPGVGKTSLVRRMVEQRPDLFPRPIVELGPLMPGFSGPDDSLGAAERQPWAPYRQNAWGETLRDISDDKASLVIVDDVDPIASTTVMDYERADYLRSAQAVLDRTRNTPVIVVSPWNVVEGLDGALAIALEPLDESNVRSLLTKVAAQAGMLLTPVEQAFLLDRFGRQGLPRQLLAGLEEFRDVQLGGRSLTRFAGGLQPFEVSGLVGVDGRPLNAGSSQSIEMVSAFVSVSDTIRKDAAKNPEIVYDITPRQFEELVAELFLERGYEVQLTPAQRDGGLDLWVARKVDLGSLNFMVECKRYGRGKPVGVALVRALYGSLEESRATGAVMITTSHFTKGAREFQSRVEHRMTLHDYSLLKEWLQQTP